MALLERRQRETRMCGDVRDVEACTESSERRTRTMQYDRLARHATTWFDTSRVIHDDPKDELSSSLRIRLVDHSSSSQLHPSEVHLRAQKRDGDELKQSRRTSHRNTCTPSNRSCRLDFRSRWSVQVATRPSMVMEERGRAGRDEGERPSRRLDDAVERMDARHTWTWQLARG